MIEMRTVEFFLFLDDVSSLITIRPAVGNRADDLQPKIQTSRPPSISPRSAPHHEVSINLILDQERRGVKTLPDSDWGRWRECGCYCSRSTGDGNRERRTER